MSGGGGFRVSACHLSAMSALLYTYVKRRRQVVKQNVIVWRNFLSDGFGKVRLNYEFGLNDVITRFIWIPSLYPPASCHV